MLIDQLSKHAPTEKVCRLFDVSESSYYEYRRRQKIVDVERVKLRANVVEISLLTIFGAKNKIVFGYKHNPQELERIKQFNEYHVFLLKLGLSVLFGTIITAHCQ